jgi:hypothetical protein
VVKFLLLTRNCCWFGLFHTIDASCAATICVAIFLRRLETITNNLQKTRDVQPLNSNLFCVTSSPEKSTVFYFILQVTIMYTQSLALTLLKWYLLCCIAPIIDEGNTYSIPWRVLKSMQLILCINSWGYIKILNHSMT